MYKKTFLNQWQNQEGSKSRWVIHKKSGYIHLSMVVPISYTQGFSYLDFYGMLCPRTYICGVEYMLCQVTQDKTWRLWDSPWMFHSDGPWQQTVPKCNTIDGNNSGLVILDMVEPTPAPQSRYRRLAARRRTTEAGKHVGLVNDCSAPQSTGALTPHTSV